MTLLVEWRIHRCFRRDGACFGGVPAQKYRFWKADLYFENRYLSRKRLKKYRLRKTDLFSENRCFTRKLSWISKIDILNRCFGKLNLKMIEVEFDYLTLFEKIERLSLVCVIHDSVWLDIIRPWCWQSIVDVELSIRSARGLYTESVWWLRDEWSLVLDDDAGFWRSSNVVARSS